MNWYVYICRSTADHYYVGISPDPKKRLFRHNSGQGSKMAKDQHGFSLVYVSAPYASKSEARLREVQLKRWMRVKQEKLIKGEWL